MSAGYHPGPDEYNDAVGGIEHPKISPIFNDIFVDYFKLHAKSVNKAISKTYDIAMNIIKNNPDKTRKELIKILCSTEAAHLVRESIFPTTRAITYMHKMDNVIDYLNEPKNIEAAEKLYRTLAESTKVLHHFTNTVTRLIAPTSNYNLNAQTRLMYIGVNRVFEHIRNDTDTNRPDVPQMSNLMPEFEYNEEMFEHLLTLCESTRKVFLYQQQTSQIASDMTELLGNVYTCVTKLGAIMISDFHKIFIPYQKMMKTLPDLPLYLVLLFLTALWGFCKIMQEISFIIFFCVVSIMMGFGVGNTRATNTENTMLVIGNPLFAKAFIDDNSAAIAELLFEKFKFSTSPQWVSFTSNSTLDLLLRELMEASIIANNGRPVQLNSVNNIDAFKFKIAPINLYTDESKEKILDYGKEILKALLELYTFVLPIYIYFAFYNSWYNIIVVHYKQEYDNYTASNPDTDPVINVLNFNHAYAVYYDNFGASKKKLINTSFTLVYNLFNIPIRDQDPLFVPETAEPVNPQPRTESSIQKMPGDSES